MSTPVAPAQGSVLTRLLNAIGTTVNSPADAGQLGMAAGLLGAGGWTPMRPTTVGQGISAGLQDAQAYRHAALANTLQQTALIPYQKARAQIATNVANGGMYQLTPAEQAAVASGKFTPQILQKLSGMETQLKVLGVNTDSIPIFREAETWAKNNVTPYGQPAN
ncbi:MAG: hypothetical protein KGL35_16965, partial [Bradyrhizobium sp.]|nr:hypothetical protein [Bradyrhizobium sp.]